MATTEDTLSEIERLIKACFRQAAEEKLQELILSFSVHEIEEWDVDLRRLINGFHKKRRRSLLGLLDQRTTPPKETEEQKPSVSSLEHGEQALAKLETEFAQELASLSEYHIYQWDTYYRDCISSNFRRFLTLASACEVATAVRHPLEAHASEIFLKGYQYQSQQSAPHTRSVVKALGGLEEFLGLVIEAYLLRVGSVSKVEGGKLRSLGSTFIRSILFGFAQVQFGRESGASILANQPRSWANYVGFMTADDLRALIVVIGPSDFSDELKLTVVPLLSAIDKVVASQRDYLPLPVLAQFESNMRRLDLELQPPVDSTTGRRIEIRCYLNDDWVNERELKEAARLGVCLVIAPLRPDLQDAVADDEALSTIVKHAYGQDSAARSVQVYTEVLESSIYQQRSKLSANAPISHNFARGFPLRNPGRQRYFHVARSSVRDLLNTFERRNGVRLWCSVRRSGKTTACFDLRESSGQSIIVPQTCDSTDEHVDSNLFYNRVKTAIETGDQVPDDFFRALVNECAGAADSVDRRIVFVVDEYETLFGRMSAGVRKNPDLKYLVAQPLLNQMAAFSRHNLLVLMGQQPNAHFILMDQNQLSPYVEQDPFPLFEHLPGSTIGEFSELLRKILTEHIRFDPTFADQVFSETAGHPWLTVNVLVELVEWLIDQKRPRGRLSLKADDFLRFARDKLNPSSLALSSEYDFFRRAISDALTDESSRHNPWLHSVYWSMKRICDAESDRLWCDRRKFAAIVNQLDLSRTGLSTEDILRTGTQANFLTFSEDIVKPKIRILGRLAAIASPAVVP